MEWFFRHPRHAAFKKRFVQNQLSYAQRMAAFAITYYFVFGFLDFYLATETTWQLFKVRISITLLLMLFLALTYHKKTQGYWQFLIGILVFISGLGVIIMSAYAPNIYKPIYAQGVLLVIFYGYTMNKLLLKPAILTGFSISISYFIYIYYFSNTGLEFVVTSLFFQTSTNVFGVFSVYFMQKTAFQAYLKTQRLKDHNKNLLQQSETDGLTGVGNRRYFDQRFHRLFKYESKSLSHISLLFCDIDFFKNYNDSYGHLKGDDALKNVADILAKQVPAEKGMLARFGGEEFILVLFNHDYEATENVIADIQSKLKTSAIEHKSSQTSEYLTLSFGFVIYRTEHTAPSDAFKQLINRSDMCLYQAKQQGRNRAVGDYFN